MGVVRAGMGECDQGACGRTLPVRAIDVSRAARLRAHA